MTDEKSGFERFEVTVDDVRRVTARFYNAAGDERLHATLILGHGAGAGQQSAFMVTFARALADRGMHVVTFDFPYMQARRRSPDPTPVLEGTWRAVIAAACERPEHRGRRLFIGGKSMGGRIASHVAADPSPATPDVAGLVFLGYPLHPPNRPQQRRDSHLGRITVPMLFVQGERDTFGTAEEMRELTARLPGAELYVVDGGNHSLEPPKRGHLDRDAVFGALQDQIAAWIGRWAAL
jgi:predicted alpha/beta-hydrolase family hydrolase